MCLTQTFETASPTEVTLAEFQKFLYYLLILLQHWTPNNFLGLEQHMDVDCNHVVEAVMQEL